MAQILGKKKSLTVLEAAQLFDLQFTTKLLNSLFLDTCDIPCEDLKEVLLSLISLGICQKNFEEQNCLSLKPIASHTDFRGSCIRHWWPALKFKVISTIFSERGGVQQDTAQALEVNAFTSE